MIHVKTTKSQVIPYSPNFKGIHALEKKKIYEKLKNDELAQKFFFWTNNIFISTKDYGMVRFSPNIWTLLQWKIVEAYFEKNSEFIYVLKARQLGGTTICIALNLFSLFVFPDLKAILVGASYDQIDIPILKMREAYSSIPKSLRISKIRDSQKKMMFSNGNYIVYFYPSLKQSKMGQMGRGGSFNYAHFTEVANMANERDIEVVEASLSTHYPYRKYIYETPLALDTPVLTTDGWKTIGTVKEGDFVFDEKGNKCKVLGKSPVFFNRVCYKITFSSGEEIIADEDHLWEVYFDLGKKILKTKELIAGRHYIKENIEKVEKLDYSLPVQCIAVDNESHLFLVGKSLIPTHNTANGYNFFYDRWEANKTIPTSRCIFMGWWAREDCILMNKEELDYYLSSPVFEWENEKIKEVKERYGIAITDKQIAWWRKQAIVKYSRNEPGVLSELPFTEDDAFAASTYQLLDKSPIDFMSEMKKLPSISYTVSWGNQWYEVDIKKSSFGPLKFWKTWEEKNPFAQYIMGVDPAFSTDPDSCESAFVILECYSDRAYQIAEFALNTLDLQRFALLVLYCAQKFNAIVNYEVQGGGQAFMPFLQNIFYLAKSINYKSGIWEEIKTSALREYIYKRRDSLSSGQAKGVVMTPELKKRAFGNLQSGLNNRWLIVRSTQLIDEIRNVDYRKGEFLLKRSMGTDRLMALLIALIAYQDVQFSLNTEEVANQKYEEFKKNKDLDEQEERKLREKQFNEYLKNMWFNSLGIPKS